VDSDMNEDRHTLMCLLVHACSTLGQPGGLNGNLRLITMRDVVVRTNTFKCLQCVCLFLVSVKVVLMMMVDAASINGVLPIEHDGAIGGVWMSIIGGGYWYNGDWRAER